MSDKPPNRTPTPNRTPITVTVENPSQKAQSPSVKVKSSSTAGDQSPTTAPSPQNGHNTVKPGNIRADSGATSIVSLDSVEGQKKLEEFRGSSSAGSSTDEDNKSVSTASSEDIKSVDAEEERRRYANTHAQGREHYGDVGQGGGGQGGGSQGGGSQGGGGSDDKGGNNVMSNWAWLALLVVSCIFYPIGPALVIGAYIGSEVLPKIAGSFSGKGNSGSGQGQNSQGGDGRDNGRGQEQSQSQAQGQNSGSSRRPMSTAEKAGLIVGGAIGGTVALPFLAAGLVAGAPFYAAGAIAAGATIGVGAIGYGIGCAAYMGVNHAAKGLSAAYNYIRGNKAQSQEPDQCQSQSQTQTRQRQNSNAQNPEYSQIYDDKSDLQSVISSTDGREHRDALTRGKPTTSNSEARSLLLVDLTQQENGRGKKNNFSRRGG